MHDHGNEENFFDRVDFKPSQADTINVNRDSRAPGSRRPNSYDAQNATAWSGLVVDNGGLGPDGQVVGPQDQRSKIRTINFAPTWTHLDGPNTVFTFGGFVRQDQFNYYPEPRPVRRPHARSATSDRGAESHADEPRVPRERVLCQRHP